MLPSNYKEFLSLFGISHFQFVIILILAFLLLSLIVLLYKLGLLSKISFKQYTLPTSTILFTHYSGSYDTINHKFQEVISDMNKVMKFSTLFGIFYDNPTEV